MKHSDAPMGVAVESAPAAEPAVLLAMPREVQRRVKLFAEILARWNKTIQLVSPRDMAEVWPRHIADALQLVPLIPPQTEGAVDLGSGGGFPGLVLAIATGIHFDLVEADTRKAAFLREAAMATQASATIHARRVENLTLPPRRLVTARALAPLRRLLDLSAPLLAVGGLCLFPKGEQVEPEIIEAEAEWTMCLRQLPSRTSQSARIIEISGLRRRVQAR